MCIFVLKLNKTECVNVNANKQKINLKKHLRSNFVQGI